MRSKGNSPTAAQKKWWSELVEMGCLLGDEIEAEIDHLVGASAQAEGENIGNWWVIPLCPRLHRLGPINRTTKPHLFQMRFCTADHWDDYRKELFLASCTRYMVYYNKPLPFSSDILQSIMRYRR